MINIQIATNRLKHKFPCGSIGYIPRESMNKDQFTVFPEATRDAPKGTTAQFHSDEVIFLDDEKKQLPKEYTVSYLTNDKYPASSMPMTLPKAKKNALNLIKYKDNTQITINKQVPVYTVEKSTTFHKVK